ncbi:MAG: GTPase, partial [Planctomycetota bacterium]
MNETEYSNMPSRRLKRRALRCMEDLPEWKPAQRMLARWAPRIENVTERTQRRRFSVVAVTGGVKVGKSTVANRIAGCKFSPADTRPETDHAVVAKPPTLSDSALENLFSGSSPELHDVEMPGWPDDVVLVDTPDFDSDRDKNASTARRIIRLADVVVVVGSQEKSYSSRQLDWCKQWTDTKTFLFVHNTGGDPNQVENIEAERQRQRENLQAQGFNAESIFCIDIPEEVQQIRRAIWQSGSRSQEIQQSQLLQCVAGITREFEREYGKRRDAIGELRSNIETHVIEPWHEQMREYGFVAERDAFVRKLTFGAGPRIGGPLGLFLRLRKYFDPIGFGGLFGQKLAPTGALKTAVAAGGAIWGFAKRMVQSWRDGQALKGKKIVKGDLPQADEETQKKLQDSAQRAGFVTHQDEGRGDSEDRKALQRHAGEVIETVMEE